MKSVTNLLRIILVLHVLPYLLYSIQYKNVLIVYSLKAIATSGEQFNAKDNELTDN
jgi:hypothetical protein